MKKIIVLIVLFFTTNSFCQFNFAAMFKNKYNITHENANEGNWSKINGTFIFYLDSLKRNVSFKANDDLNMVAITKNCNQKSNPDCYILEDGKIVLIDTIEIKFDQTKTYLMKCIRIFENNNRFVLLSDSIVEDRSGKNSNVSGSNAHPYVITHMKVKSKDQESNDIGTWKLLKNDKYTMAINFQNKEFIYTKNNNENKFKFIETCNAPSYSGCYKVSNNATIIIDTSEVANMENKKVELRLVFKIYYSDGSWNLLLTDAVIEDRSNKSVFFCTEKDLERVLVWAVKNSDNEPRKGNSWCYKDEFENCEKYGRLYDWESAKNVCPDGWYLPGEKQWNHLVGDIKNDVARIKTKTGWLSNGNGYDEFGFSALPGGMRSEEDGKFYDRTHAGIWWTSQEKDDKAQSRLIMKDKSSMYESDMSKLRGLSVRCVTHMETAPAK
jgi:uncharacterized protein (TIGR02145 family)